MATTMFDSPVVVGGGPVVSSNDDYDDASPATKRIKTANLTGFPLDVFVYMKGNYKPMNAQTVHGNIKNKKLENFTIDDDNVQISQVNNFRVTYNWNDDGQMIKEFW